MFFPPSDDRNPLTMVIAHALMSMLEAETQDKNGRTKFRGDHLIQDLDQQWNNPFITALAIRTALNNGLMSQEPCACRPGCLNVMVELTNKGRDQGRQLNAEMKNIQEKIEAKWGPIAQVERAVREGTMSMKEILDHVHGPKSACDHNHQTDPTETPDMLDVVTIDLSEPMSDPRPDLDDLAQRLKARMGKSGTVDVPRSDPQNN